MKMAQKFTNKHDVSHEWCIETNNGTDDKKDYLKRLVNGLGKSKAE